MRTLRDEHCYLCNSCPDPHSTYAIVPPHLNVETLIPVFSMHSWESNSFLQQNKKAVCWFSQEGGEHSLLTFVGFCLLPSLSLDYS